MYTLNARINNRHKIVQILNNGTINEFSDYIKNHALFFYGDTTTDYYYIKGYVANINMSKKEWGLTTNLGYNSNLKNAFNNIKK